MAPQKRPTKSFFDYLNEKSIGCDRPFIIKKFLENYRKECSHTKSIRGLLVSFNKTWSPVIHRLGQFDDETKARMMFAASIRIPDGFLQKLRRRATIELDTSRRIIKYESPTLRLHGEHNKGGRPKRQRPPVNYDDDQDEQEEQEEDDLQLYSNPIVPPIVVSPPPSRDGNDSIQLLSGMCSPVPIKHDVAEYTTGTELVPYNSYSNPYASQPQASSFPALSGGLIGGMSNFMNALSGLMQSQTEMIRAMSRSNSSSTTTTVPPVAAADTQTFSVLEFLKHLQQWILNSNLIQLAEFHQKLANSLQNLAGENRKIPVSRLKLALEAAFSICSSSVGNGAQMHLHCVNLKEFVTMLLMYASSQQLYGFCEQIKQKFDGFGAETEISMDTARTALEATYGIVME